MSSPEASFSSPGCAGPRRAGTPARAWWGCERGPPLERRQRWVRVWISTRGSRRYVVVPSASRGTRARVARSPLRMSRGYGRRRASRVVARRGPRASAPAATAPRDPRRIFSEGGARARPAATPPLESATAGADPLGDAGSRPARLLVRPPVASARLSKHSRAPRSPRTPFTSLFSQIKQCEPLEESELEALWRYVKEVLVEESNVQPVNSPSRCAATSTASSTTC